MVPFLLALRFVLELCLLASAAVIGLALSDRAALSIAASVALVGAVGFIWGAVLAPRRRINLPLAARIAIELALFVAAGIGLAAVGYPAAAVALVATEVLLLTILAALGHPPGSQPRPQTDSR